MLRRYRATRLYTVGSLQIIVFSYVPSVHSDRHFSPNFEARFDGFNRHCISFTKKRDNICVL